MRMTQRMSITLFQHERDALWQLAGRERRDPRDQAAKMVVAELNRLGLLPDIETSIEHQAPDTDTGSPTPVAGGGS